MQATISAQDGVSSVIMFLKSVTSSGKSMVSLQTDLFYNQNTQPIHFLNKNNLFLFKYSKHLQKRKFYKIQNEIRSLFYKN